MSTTTQESPDLLTARELRLRLAVDVGGTFTDLVIEDERGALELHKSSTTPDDPVQGVMNVLGVAESARETDLEMLLGQTDLFIFGTTRATNAILTGNTARTAFLTTKGHPDVLLFREGGRVDTFDNTRKYPGPYVPRALTYEVTERIGSGGEIVTPLDEELVISIIQELATRDVEAVAVCFLWSIVNPSHEERVGELLHEYLPRIPVTLSHVVNPALREYRRASSAAIDASLKPLMTDHLARLENELRQAGFGGRLVVVTSAGGVLDADEVARAPIHSIGSGPASAPVAGRFYALVDAQSDTAIVTDTGGTSYDVSLVRRGRIPTTRETWLGDLFQGHITGFPSVDVKSIGAGGGSIAWVDDGGLLHIGPQSAGAVPGPICYGRGGTQVTVTDASLVLGYIDPEYFLGGTMALDAESARRGVKDQLADKLGLDVVEAASAVLRLTTEHMVRAIESITLNQGIDPREAVLVAGGGAGGLNAVAIARQLGCEQVLVPPVAAVLSAAGELIAELTADYASTLHTTSSDFDADGVGATLSHLQQQCNDFISRSGVGALESAVTFTVEARYADQAWELDLPVRTPGPIDESWVTALSGDFHALHREVFAVNDPGALVEFVTWRARAQCRLRSDEPPGRPETGRGSHAGTRRIYFPVTGFVNAAVYDFAEMRPGAWVEGPAVIESPVTTVVLDPSARAQGAPTGSLVITSGIGGKL